MSAVLRSVSYLDFQKICMTVGQAIRVEPNPSASIPAYLIRLCFNELLMAEHKALYKKDVYTSSAQLCANHTVEEITGERLLTVINFPRKQIGKNMSDCLITGVQKETSNAEEKRASTVFMKPSSQVALGAKVSLLAEDVVFDHNSRDLNWGEFLTADLRIGTLEEFQDLHPLTGIVNRVLFSINLGELGKRTCIAMLNNEVSLDSLIGRQVLVLTNLDPNDKIELFLGSGNESILCTFGGRSVLEPAKIVENGFKLA